MSRSRHPNKHIAQAVQDAEAAGWRVVPSGGHAWGRLLCPDGTPDGCIVGVWSTPRAPENHARQITRAVRRCPHTTRPPAETEATDDGA